MPRETLTRDQIVRAAIELLDAEGLDGLNMRSLGQRLDSAATAVYWHVGSKAGLIALAGDQLWQEIALPELGEADWRTAAAQMAGGLYAMLCRHPWLVRAFGSFPVFGPGKARYDDHHLALYEAAGFSGAQVDQATAAVVTFVLGNALGPAATATFGRPRGRDGTNNDKLLRESMAQAREIALRYPRLRARLETAAAEYGDAAEYGAAPEHTFEFGLQALLDGMEAQLLARRAPPHDTRAPRAASPST